MSQDYLAQVAEGKILPKEGLLELTEDTALFADGTSERIDAAVFATGYELSLPFLAQDVQQSIAIDGTQIDLYCHHLPSRLTKPGLCWALCSSWSLLPRT
jgi:flavin-binding monooxygenase-like protein